ncbi:hypothetical protein C8Q77DRAFT_363827 [Trametes polyzona]|nr:hypothetical protein C8Q77DRAFT_363827 [Trametes polyzona]
MPPARSLIRRRRSSLAMGLTQVKPGNYGINHNPSPRALTFAPNVTPGTYVEADDDMNDDSSSPSSALFPPTAPASAPSRRRLPPGKRLSQGYIPRPPNAFMLFRANFVRQKHVPGSIETNHGSLSKIIGNCWRALPLDEKKYWEVEAKKAKAAHKERYPHYRFRPVHNKKKKADAAAAAAGDDATSAEGSTKRKDKIPTPPSEEERCEAVAQLLLEGKKGEELAEAVRQLDMARAMSRPESAASGGFAPNPWSQPPMPLYMQRRPSSVPPPSTLFHPGHPIALPSVPFFAAPTPQLAFPGSNSLFNSAAGFGMGSSSAHGSRAPSPVGNIARTRTLLGLRRASSCQPVPSERMWDYDGFSVQQQQQQHQAYGAQTASGWTLQPDNEPLPEVTDTSIFQPGWTSSFKDASCPAPAIANYAPVDPHAPAASYSPHAHALSLNIGPLDSFDFASATASGPSTAATDAYSSTGYEPIDPHAQWPIVESGPSSAFSGSPARSDASLPPHGSVPASSSAGICAPQPQHAPLQFDTWSAEQDPHAHAHVLDPTQAAADQQQQQLQHQQQVQQEQFNALMMGFDKGFHAEFDVFDSAAEFDMGLDMGMGVGVEMGAVDYGYCAVREF